MKVEETDKYLKEFKDVLVSVSEDYTKRIDNILRKYVNTNVNNVLVNEKNVQKCKKNLILKENEINKKVKTIGKEDTNNRYVKDNNNGYGKVKTIGKVNSIENPSENNKISLRIKNCNLNGEELCNNLISKPLKKESFGSEIRGVKKDIKKEEKKEEKRSVEKVQKIKLNVKTPLKKGKMIEDEKSETKKERKSSIEILHESIKDFVEEKVIKEDISSECHIDMMTSNNNSLNFYENKFVVEKNLKNNLQFEKSLICKNEEEDNSGLTIFDLKNGDLKLDLSDSIVRVNEELDNLLAQFKNEIEYDRVLNVERCEGNKDLVLDTTEIKRFENQNIFVKNDSIVSKPKNTIEKSSNTTFFSSGSPDSKDSSLIFYKRTPVDSLYKSVIDKQIRNSRAFRNSIRFDLNSYKPKTVVPAVKLNDEEDLLDNFKLPEWAKDKNITDIVKEQSHIDLEKYFYYLEDLDVKKIFPYCSNATNESPNKFIK